MFRRFPVEQNICQDGTEDLDAGRNDQDNEEVLHHIRSCTCEKGIDDIALLFYDKDNIPYFTSIAADLQRSKYGMKTQFFGGCDNNYSEGNKDKVNIIKADELKAIDEKTHYLQKDGEYSDNVFYMISQEVKQNNEFLKSLYDSPHIVKTYLKNEGIHNIENISDEELKKYIKSFTIDDILKIKMMIVNLMKHNDESFGYIESKKQEISIFNSIFNKREKKLYDTFDMVKENKDGIEILSIIRIKLKSDFLYYVYSPETHEYELMPIEKAIEISKEYNSQSGKELINNSR